MFSCPTPRGGGGLPYKKNGTGCSSDILKRTPKWYQDPVLWAWLEMFFTPKARSKRRSIHAPNLTDELSTAE